MRFTMLELVVQCTRDVPKSKSDPKAINRNQYEFSWILTLFFNFPSSSMSSFSSSHQGK
ncbi:hypothetical protein HAX54_042551, partial [Datura stramonium]|nr:hypothetical protein [Datura stramonium]